MSMSLNQFRKAVAGASILLTLGAATAAGAQERTGGGLGSITNCDAKGGKQEAGAVMGAVAGGLLGNKLAKHDRGAGTAIGAVAGAAAGSWTGCKMQRDEAAKGERAYKGEPEGTYSSGGYRLAPYVKPAQFRRGGGRYVATHDLAVRNAPSTKAGKVGSMQVGDRFEALAYTGNWVLVGRNHVGVGYVSTAQVRPS